MTVQEIMERAGTKDTSLVLAWLKDAMHLIQSSTTDKLKVVKYNIIDGEREYLLPQDMIAVKSVAVKDTNDKKYKRIKRLVHDPVIREDTDPE
jgi:hypothetical protein|tara:strand:+ start:1494 stop:1772 length:279 start_codon:yes stop_codon:yes gene_type:complete